MSVQSESANAPQTEGKTPYLLIVARNEPDLLHHLARDFARDDKVQVLLDRRRGERRQHQQAHEPERRRVERRQPSSSRRPLSDWFVVVRRQTG